MQVNNVSWFELKRSSQLTQYLKPVNKLAIYQDIKVFKQYTNHQLPNAFIWHDSHLRPITPKLLNWLKEFVTLFDTNDMLWLASVGTADPKFRPYLMEYYNEHKANK